MAHAAQATAPTGQMITRPAIPPAIGMNPPALTMTVQTVTVTPRALIMLAQAFTVTVQVMLAIVQAMLATVEAIIVTVQIATAGIMIVIVPVIMATWCNEYRLALPSQGKSKISHMCILASLYCPMWAKDAKERCARYNPHPAPRRLMISFLGRRNDKD